MIRQLQDLATVMSSNASELKKANTFVEEENKRRKKISEDAEKEEIKNKARIEEAKRLAEQNLKLKHTENEETKKLNAEKDRIEKEIIEAHKKNFKQLTDEQKRELAAYIRKRENLEKEQKKSENLLNMMVSPMGAAKELGTNFGSMSSAVDFAKTKFTEMAGGGVGATIAFELIASGAKILGSALKGAADAAITMGKAVLNGERGMIVGAKGVSTFTKAISGAVDAFGSLAIGIGGVLTLLTPFTAGLTLIPGLVLLTAGGIAKLGASAADTAAELNEIAATLNDKLFAGFNELGKMSMTGARGMTGVIENLHKMGLTVAEFDKFRTVINNNTKEMKMFGVTAEQGVTKFAEVSGTLLESEMGKTLRLMGIQAEDQYEHTAKYLALQARLGFTQEKNNEKLAKATGSYIEELDKIAALTGATRKEQEDARSAVMAIEELRAAIESEGDEEKRKILQRGLQQAEFLQAQGLRRQATGIAQLVAAGGVPTTIQAQEAFMSQRRTYEDIVAGRGTTTSRALGSVGELGAAARQAGKIARYGAGATEGLFSEFAAYGDLRAKTQGIEEARLAAMKREGAAFDEEKFLKSFLAERKAQDETSKKNVELVDQQRNSAIILDKAVKKYNDAVGINLMASRMFAASAEALARVLGIPTGGKTGAGGGGGTSWTSGNAMGDMGGGGGYEPKASTAMSAADLTKLGLKLRPTGTVQAEGAEIHPDLIELARRIQNEIPGFNYFTAFNDKDKVHDNSLHGKGLALDFTLTQHPTPEQGKAIISQLKSMGANYGLDEYNNKSSGWTGPHIHAAIPAAMTGGLFTGPRSGYPVMLHGPETVLNEFQTSNLEKVLSQVTKQEFSDSSITSTINSPMQEMISMHEELMETLITKLGDLESRMARSNDIQENILNYSMT